MSKLFNKKSLSIFFYDDLKCLNNNNCDQYDLKYISQFTNLFDEMFTIPHLEHSSYTPTCLKYFKMIRNNL